MADRNSNAQPAQAPANQAAPAGPVTECATLGEYVRTHFRRTRGPWVFGIIAAILAVLPLSLARPKIGLPGQGLALLAVAGVFAVFGGMFLLARMTGFFVRGNRSVGDDARSLVAPFAFSALILLLSLTPLVIAECFVGDEGVAARLVPALKTMQADMGLVPADDEQQVAATGEDADLENRSNGTTESETDANRELSTAGATNEGTTNEGTTNGATNGGGGSKTTDGSPPNATDPLSPPPGEAPRRVDEKTPSDLTGDSQKTKTPTGDHANQQETRGVDAPQLDQEAFARTADLTPLLQEALQCTKVMSREEWVGHLDRYYDLAQEPTRLKPTPGDTDEQTKQKIQMAYTSALNQMQFVFRRDFVVFDFDVELGPYDAAGKRFSRLLIRIADPAWREEGKIGVDLFRRATPGDRESRVINSTQYTVLLNAKWPDSKPVQPAPEPGNWFAAEAGGEPLSAAQQQERLRKWMQSVSSSAVVCLAAPCAPEAARRLASSRLHAAVQFRSMPDDIPRLLTDTKVGSPTHMPVRFVLYSESEAGPRIEYALTLKYFRPAIPTGGDLASGGSAKEPGSSAASSTSSDSPKSPPGEADVVDGSKLKGPVAKLLEPLDPTFIGDFRRFYRAEYPKHLADLSQSELDALDDRIKDGVKTNRYFPFSVPGAAGKKPTESLEAFNQRVEQFKEVLPKAEQRIAGGADAYVGRALGGKAKCLFGIPAFGSGYDATTRRVKRVTISFDGIGRVQETIELLPLSSATDPRTSLTSPKEGVSKMTAIEGGLQLSDVELDLLDAETVRQDLERNGLAAAVVVEYIGFVRPQPDTEIRTRLPLLPRRVILYQRKTGKVLIDQDFTGQELHQDFTRLPIMRNPYPGREMREWTDEKGNQKTAKFIRRERDVVILRDESDKDVELPLKNLSTKDRNFVRRLTAPKP